AQLMKTAKVYSKTGWFSKRPRIIEDINRKQKSFKDIIVASFALGKSFKKFAKRNENIGVLLPNAIATVCTFFGLSAYERTPVMINFSVGLKNMLSMCNTAQLKTIITSRSFIIKGKLETVIEELEKAGYKIVYLEDIAKNMSLLTKISAFLNYKVKHVPHKKGGNKRAVILFTSGSEGTPKAVLLSHANLIANVCQLSAIQTVTYKDLLFNALPMFHSFGLTVGTLFPLFQGAKVFMYPSPLHYRVVAELVYELGATLMIGTDTFLRGYAKIAHPYDFHNVRLMYSGGEAAKADTRSIWMEHSGIRMMEAYGSTECSPVITANNGIFNKFGSIGKLLPGMQYKIEPVDGIATGGELCVKGPNVMLGYYMPDNPGVLVPPTNGWYHTGDVVDIDEIGFLTIKDRIKRFAKIGGEMVSLNAVQDMVISATAEMGPDYNYGVISVPHESKGEQIVLVTNNTAVTSALLHEYVKANGMSELYLPRIILYHDKLPVFATGKSDNVTLKKEVMAELSEANNTDKVA
ncbi:MAG: AMP-binding protein, partial [Alphaproteobacteria bacterium]|nr:AMP-binding protein [Alphaproteobacteria bacterium]